MDDDTIRRLSADIDELKRAVRRNDPMLHEVAAPPGWIAFSFATAACVTLFALPAHVLVGVYGSFAGIPGSYRIALFSVLGLFFVLGGIFKIKILLSRALQLDRSAGFARIADSFYGGPAVHETIPMGLGMVAGVAYSFYFGHPWVSLSVTSFIVGIMSNRIAIRGDLRAYYVLGYWGILSGLASVPFVERAPFLWLFLVYGLMFFAFAIAQIVEKARMARDSHGQAIGS